MAENYIHEINRLKRETIDLIKQIYRKNAVGGALHVVLDDGNVTDEDVLWCLQETIPQEKEDKKLFEQCAINLIKLGTKGRRLYCIDKAFAEMQGE